jgi:hypothetical protein
VLYTSVIGALYHILCEDSSACAISCLPTQCLWRDSKTGVHESISSVVAIEPCSWLRWTILISIRELIEQIEENKMNPYPSTRSPALQPWHWFCWQKIIVGNLHTDLAANSRMYNRQDKTQWFRLILKFSFEIWTVVVFSFLEIITTLFAKKRDYHHTTHHYWKTLP